MASHKKTDWKLIDIIDRFLLCYYGGYDMKKFTIERIDNVKELLDIDTETLHETIIDRMTHHVKHRSYVWRRRLKELDMDHIDKNIEEFRKYVDYVEPFVDDVKTIYVEYEAPEITDEYTQHRNFTNKIKNRVDNIFDETDEIVPETYRKIFTKISKAIGQTLADETFGELNVWYKRYIQCFCVTNDDQIRGYLSGVYGNDYYICNIRANPVDRSGIIYIDKVEHLYPEFREF